MKPIFTRYLYYKRDVVISLMINILEKRVEKAIFWAYELYFSGFEKELFHWLTKLYKKYYASVNTKKWGAFLEEKMREWGNNHYKHAIIATIVHTMALRDSISDGNKKIFLKRDGEPDDSSSIKFVVCPTIFYVLYKNTDVEKYKTIKAGIIRPYRIMQQACIYSTEKNVDTRWLTFLEDEEDRGDDEDDEEDESRESILQKYFYHWEYYSFFTPVWKERIKKYGGIINDETRKIDFPNEELGEAFYGEYGYEPDEQSGEITDRTIGKNLTIHSDN